MHSKHKLFICKCVNVQKKSVLVIKKLPRERHAVEMTCTHTHTCMGQANKVNINFLYWILETFGFNLINMFVNNVSISILSDG